MRIYQMTPPSFSISWQALQDEADSLKNTHLYPLFASDPLRFKKLSLSASNVLMDFSKQLLVPETLQKLVLLAEEKELPRWIERLFAGEEVNASEQRAALHWALRLPQDIKAPHAQTSLVQQVHSQLDKMRKMVELLRGGRWRGHSGKVITDVVNIGVGGSDLGPMMAFKALEDTATTANAQLDSTVPEVHFVSSMEGSQISRLLQQLNPETTLFIIASKSFTTSDTLANVDTALAWLKNHQVDEALVKRCHFVGVSTRADLMQGWGIVPEHQLEFWDWVGGRFSLWSTVGLSLATRIGFIAFEEFLAGAHFMDEHFRTTPLLQNLPVVNALIGVWNTNFLNINAHAILPYDGRLKHLPAYLEQLEMESNGKSVCRDGRWVAHRTCPIIWGEVGPNAQHAFYQLLHQGTERVSSDFVMVANRYREAHYESVGGALQQQHRLGLANGLAQSQLLALGEKVLPNADQLPAHKRYQGNQPNTTFVLEELTPYNLGTLLALYEHKVFVQSVIWGINPFDQWGVELGKKLADKTYELLEQGHQVDLSSVDSSTAGLLAFLQELQQ